MKLSGFFIVGMAMAAASPLRADPREASANDQSQESAHLKNEEGKLEQMQANRRLNNARSLQAQEEYRAGTAELSGHDAQQFQDVQDLRSVEGQVSAGQKQKIVSRQNYKDAVQKYGSDDPRSRAAQQSLNKSRQAMLPLLKSRRTLKQNVHEGRMRVHNDKTVLSVQKRDMDSDARYGAEDDRNIEKKEETIAADRRTMASNISKAQPSLSKSQDQMALSPLISDAKADPAAARRP